MQEVEQEVIITSNINSAYAENDLMRMAEGYLKLSKYYLEKSKLILDTEPMQSNKLILWSLGLLYHLNNMLEANPGIEAEYLTEQIKQRCNEIKEYYIIRIDADPKLAELISELAISSREKINLLRQEISSQLSICIAENIESTVKSCTARYNELIAIMYKKIQSNFKPLPCDYAVVSFGSISSGLVTPYSDLDFAILVAENDSEAVEYFRQLTMLVAMSIIEVSETSLRCLGIPYFKDLEIDYKHMFKRGFRMDSLIPKFSKNPLGNFAHNNYAPYELILTVNDMLALQYESKQSANSLNAEYLSRILFVCGNEYLVCQYNELLRRFLKMNKTFLADRILDYDFSKGLYNMQLKTEYYVKHELQRPIELFIHLLSKLYLLPTISVWDSLDFMLDKLLNKANHDHLYQALCKIILLRNTVYEYYKKQRDNVFVQTRYSDDCKDLYCFTDLAYLIQHYILCRGIYSLLGKFIIGFNYVNKERLLLRDSIIPKNNAVQSDIFAFCLDERLSRNNQVLNDLKTNSLYLFLEKQLLTADFFTEIEFDATNLDDIKMLNMLLKTCLALTTYFLSYGKPRVSSRLINSTLELFELYQKLITGNAIELSNDSDNLLRFAKQLASVDAELPTLLAIALAYKGKLFFYLDGSSITTSKHYLQLACKLREEIDAFPEQYDDSFNPSGVDSILIKRWGIFAYKTYSDNEKILLDSIKDYSGIRHLKDDLNYNECTASIAFIETKLANMSTSVNKTKYLESAKNRLEEVINKPNITQFSTYAKYLNLLAWVVYYSDNLGGAAELFMQAYEFINSQFDVNSQAKVDAYIGLAYTSTTEDSTLEYLQHAKRICVDRYLPKQHHFYEKINELTTRFI